MKFKVGDRVSVPVRFGENGTVTELKDGRYGVEFHNLPMTLWYDAHELRPTGKGFFWFRMPTMKLDPSIILAAIGITALAAIGATSPKLTPLPPKASSVVDEPNDWCNQCPEHVVHATVYGHISGSACDLTLYYLQCRRGHRWIRAEAVKVGFPVTRQETPYRPPPLPTFKHGTFGYAGDAGLTNIQTRLPPLPPSNAEAEIYKLIQRSRDAAPK